jgi:hypothetical protein
LGSASKSRPKQFLQFCETRFAKLAVAREQLGEFLFLFDENEAKEILYNFNF